ncbi:hypothetical protein MARA_53720 [Mycolicibacterium arabiense]|uniref:Uncharacterized protein n=2 Tax=Mycolicibacterium arabiense TaxID=1286181 RepID=A0A7I7S4T2_9MYCO|nr:hypothetical protein MARA_53720 [Mycolicibacterium arabiense]
MVSVPNAMKQVDDVEYPTEGTVMRTKRTLAAAMGIAAAAVIPAGVAVAEEESASEVIARLQSEGYTVNIDKVGSGPIDSCTVTSVRNPQSVSQLVPYIGPGFNGDNRILVPQITSQTVSVSLVC